MDAWLPTYHRLLAASPAPDQPEASETARVAAHSCVDREPNLLLKHKHSLVSEETNPFSIMESDVRAQQIISKGNTYQKQAEQVGEYQAPGVENSEVALKSTFADKVALANQHQMRLNSRDHSDNNQSPSQVCQVEGCGRYASPQTGGGVCNFSIMGGLSKGCGRSFCAEHSGSKCTDDDSNEEDGYFRANNYDDEYGPCALAPYDKSPSGGSNTAILETQDTDQGSERSVRGYSTSSGVRQRQFITAQDRQKSECKEKKPFDGQVCCECQPRLRRTFKVSVAMMCGVPAVVSLVCLAVLGGHA